MRYRWIVLTLLLALTAALPLVLTADKAPVNLPRSPELAGAPSLDSGCLEYIVNGGFENSNGWFLPLTEYSAGYSTAQAECSARSLRLGIVNPLDNRYAYSDANQQVTLPADATSITLYYTTYTISGEAGPVPTPYPRMMGDPRLMDWLPYDVQYLLILDKYDNWIDTSLWQCRNDQTWVGWTADLTAYRGQTIKLHFGAYNQGTGGVTAMYLDNVSLAVCQPDTATPTPVTPSPTPTQTRTPTPSMTPVPLVCPDVLLNGGFESVSAWNIPATEYTAGYSTAHAYNGTHSMRMGIVASGDNRYAYSDVNQTVSIPADASTVMLRYYTYPSSGDAGPVPTPYPRALTELSAVWLPYDVQYLLILDATDHWIDTKMWECRNDQAWLYHQVDLSAYVGRTIKLHFGAYNQGSGGVTSMYLDNVSLEICRPPTVTPTPVTPSPTPLPMLCPEALSNGGFETSTGWYLPATEYTAGYATWPVHTGARSLRMGIANPGDNRYAYSDANQDVTIPASASSVTLRFYSYPVSGDAGPVPTPYPRSMTQLSAIWLPYDVQYLLLLDKYGAWIDTLMWECSNTAAWGYHTFDLSAYAGETIKLHFGAYNQGTGGVTTLYLDDVSLEVCAPAPVMPSSLTLPLILRNYVVFGPGATATPTATLSAPTPTPTATSAYPYPGP